MGTAPSTAAAVTGTQQPFPAAAGFTGWYRDNPRQRFRELVTADTEPQCWRLLLAALKTHSCGGESLVLPSGRDPDANGRRG